MDYTRQYFDLLIETTETRDYNKLKKCIRNIKQTGGLIDQTKMNELVSKIDNKTVKDALNNLFTNLNKNNIDNNKAINLITTNNKNILDKLNEIKTNITNILSKISGDINNLLNIISGIKDLDIEHNKEIKQIFDNILKINKIKDSLDTKIKQLSQQSPQQIGGEQDILSIYSNLNTNINKLKDNILKTEFKTLVQNLYNSVKKDELKKELTDMEKNINDLLQNLNNLSGSYGETAEVLKVIQGLELSSDIRQKIDEFNTSFKDINKVINEINDQLKK